MLSRASGTALVLLVLLSSAGCGGKGGSPDAAPPTTPSTTPAAPVTTPTAATTTAGAASTGTTPSTTPTGTCAESRTLADGSWTGPITMDVDGKGGTAAFTSSQGRGTLALVVANGKVTSGTWNVRWTSHGHADTGKAAADLDVVGTIRGTAGGKASAPVLSGTWEIKGTAKITKPIHSSAPVDDTGPDTETLTLRRSTGCGTTIEGTFVPSFNSKDAAASFDGKADWRGTRS